MTKLGEKRVRRVRVMGGNTKFRALRLQEGNFSFSSEGVINIINFINYLDRQKSQNSWCCI